MNRLLATVLAAALLGAGADCALAANVQAGAAKAKEVCAACHALNGNSPSADFPKIGGQQRDYLAHSLRAYKKGTRKNPIMAGFAGALTDQDIDNVAAYYASQPATVFLDPGELHRRPQ